MEWTTTPPDKEGYYWYCADTQPPTTVYVIRCGDGELRTSAATVYSADDDYTRGQLSTIPDACLHGAHWIGPLIVPTPPGAIARSLAEFDKIVKDDLRRIRTGKRLP